MPPLGLPLAVVDDPLGGVAPAFEPAPAAGRGVAGFGRLLPVDPAAPPVPVPVLAPPPVAELAPAAALGCFVDESDVDALASFSEALDPGLVDVLGSASAALT